MRRFSYGKTLIVGFGFLGISIVWPIFNQFIPIFLQAGNPEFERQLLQEGREIPNVAGFALAPSLALFIMTWDNIINVFVQPWVGERSDRTWSRFGRRKPWILAGVPIAVLGFVFIPLAQTVLAIAVFILITNLGMALFRSPTVAWLGDLFDPEDRSQANGIINLMGGVGGLLAFVGGGWLFDNAGRSAPFIFGAGMLVVAAAVAVWLVKEPGEIAAPERDTAGVLANLRLAWSDPNKSALFVLLAILLWFMAFNALEAGLSSFAVFSLGLEPGTASIYAAAVTLSFIVFAVPAGLLGTRLGRRPVILIGLVGLAAFLLLSFFLIQGAATFIAMLVVLGLFWALVNVNSLPLVYDYGDEGKIGAYTGLYYFSSQSAAVLGPTLGGVMVQALGSQYRWLFLFSTIFMVLAFAAMVRVKAMSNEQHSSLIAHRSLLITGGIMDELVRVERRDDIFEIVLNRPEKRNAINLALYRQLDEAIVAAGRAGGVRVLFVRGEGPAFSAGIDVTAFLQLPEQYGDPWQQQMRLVTADFQAVLNRLERLEIPVVALLHGYCLGLALELALACDIRLAAEGTRLGLPETRLGIIPDVGGTTRLARLAGPGRAKELIFTGRQIDAELAAQWGIVNHVVPAGALLAKAEELAAEIRQAAPLAVGMAKRVIDGLADVERGLALEGWAQSQLIATEDFGEGVQSFLMKRPAVFKGK
ncbi:MAG: MFS transporter [Chloroflexi bacterium]|nr:MFS transporter [Chloroflexota bacterium]MCI0578999.1 MFS transporter [Chloroflexota bacterium]MCI0644786.1 MFS transporter [Chloroflexota bacterium]MCI0731961.1 MFS transporter [Chloroflexota bacterium]